MVRFGRTVSKYFAAVVPELPGEWREAGSPSTASRLPRAMGCVVRGRKWERRRENSLPSRPSPVPGLSAPALHPTEDVSQLGPKGPGLKQW